ncbi:PhzF family phenazine biosynthesis protein [Aliidiomarina haloalkalitolerans]|uniref:Isomerase n=1 Tax=Aliidiomarina haloalkalitolerans TaxID=859059 RepID=A0A432VZ18_9GAMM|nr:PhzF family phenazine biosynthesis protein [Aliidiomarina haloalkalitolerans]RUO21900.1 isomerase [Aliidiomarina haloalkalitolerans]
MQIKLYQVDSFSDRPFAGNPAAVCPLGAWLDDDMLQAIAEENNLSETAFFVPEGDGFRLRWFTPEAEVDLCGHATLAAAHVLYTHLHSEKPSLHFYTRSGELVVSKEDDSPALTMDFPASYPQAISGEARAGLLNFFEGALGVRPVAVASAFDYIVEFASAADVQAVVPDHGQLSLLDGRGVVITAPGDDCDFVSRCFFPKLRVNEDPVTGSAHCELAPYWFARWQQERSEFVAKQLSRRGGTVHCRITGDGHQRVELKGTVADYCQGTITLVNP